MIHLSLLSILAVIAIFVDKANGQTADLCKAHGKGQSLLQRHDTFRSTLVYPNKQAPPGLKCDEKLNAEAAKYAEAYASSPGDALQAAYQEQRPDVWENRFSASLNAADAAKFDAQMQERFAVDAFGQWICPQKAELGAEYTQAAWFHNIEFGMAVAMNKEKTKYAVVALYRFNPAPTKDPAITDAAKIKKADEAIKAYYTNALSTARKKEETGGPKVVPTRGSKAVAPTPDGCAEEKEDEQLHKEFTADEPKKAQAEQGAKIGFAAISSSFSDASDFAGGGMNSFGSEGFGGGGGMNSFGGNAVSIGNGREGGLGAGRTPGSNPAGRQVQAMYAEAANQLQGIDYWVYQNHGKELLDQYAAGTLKKKGDDFVAEAAKVIRAVQLIAMDFCFANHPGAFVDINQEAMCFKKEHNVAQMQKLMECTDDLLVKTHKLAGIKTGDPKVPAKYDRMLQENHVYETMTVLYDRYCHYHEYNIADEARRAFDIQLRYTAAGRIAQPAGVGTPEDRGLEFRERWLVVRDSVEKDAKLIWENHKYLSDFEKGMRIHSVESKMLDLCMLDNPIVMYNEKNLKKAICEGNKDEGDEELEALLRCANTWANWFTKAWRTPPFDWDRVVKVNKDDVKTPFELAAIGAEKASKPSFVRALTVRFCGRKDTVFMPIAEAAEKATPKGKEPNKNLIRAIVMHELEMVSKGTKVDVGKIQTKVANKVAEIAKQTDALEADIKGLEKKNKEFPAHNQEKIDELSSEIQKLDANLERLGALAKALELAKDNKKAGEIKKQVEDAKKSKEALVKSLDDYEETDAKSEFARRKHANQIVRKAFEYCRTSHKEGLTMVTGYDVCDQMRITTDLLELLHCTRRAAELFGSVEKVIGNYNYGYAFSKFFCWNDPWTKFLGYISDHGRRTYGLSRRADRLKKYAQLSQGIDTKYADFARHLETIADYRSLEKQGKFDQHFVPVTVKVANRGNEV